MFTDAEMRDRVSGIPVPEFDVTAFVRPRPVRDARVAIVTTAGLHQANVPGWAAVDDQSFRVLDKDDRDFSIGHWSPNFDRTGMIADLNVVYPIDRLNEMAADGEVGSVASRHIAFMGGQGSTMSTIRLDTGPAAAKVLRDDGVDAVILTPVCPYCTRTIGTLAHVLEAEGIATVALASIRGQIERLHPPRALYCEFPLGRPLGKPGDADFQRRVLNSALELFKERSGPVLADFPDIIEDGADSPLTCTIPPRDDSGLPPAVSETLGLRQAYERTLARQGRTNVGRTLTVDEIPGAVGAFTRVAEGTDWLEAGFGDVSEPTRLVEIAHDIRSYYEEAAMSLVDHVPAARSAEAWFYTKTETGMAIIRAHESMREAGAPEIAWFYILPSVRHPVRTRAPVR